MYFRTKEREYLDEFDEQCRTNNTNTKQQQQENNGIDKTEQKIKFYHLFDVKDEEYSEYKFQVKNLKCLIIF